MQELEHGAVAQQAQRDPDDRTREPAGKLVQAQSQLRVAPPVRQRCEERLARRYKKLRGLGKWGTSELTTAT